jgi:hypothetical protein
MPDDRPAVGPGLPVAPVAMTAFWMLLGGAAGVNVAQAVWHLLGWAGDVAAAVPVGGVLGAAVGALLGLVRDPSRLVLLMAVFAGASAGAVAGRLAAGAVGEFAGQAAGLVLGAGAWAAWRGSERRKDRAQPGPRGPNWIPSRPCGSIARGAGWVTSME